jgi:hypothetical protein
LKWKEESGRAAGTSAAEGTRPTATGTTLPALMGWRVLRVTTDIEERRASAGPIAKRGRKG